MSEGHVHITLRLDGRDLAKALLATQRGVTFILWRRQTVRHGR